MEYTCLRIFCAVLIIPVHECIAQFCCYEYTVGAYSTVVVMSIQYCCYCEYTVGGVYSTVVVMSIQYCCYCEYTVGPYSTVVIVSTQ